MQTKANGRAAFMIAAGLLTLYTVPALACDTFDCGRIVLAQNADPQAQPDTATTPEPAADSDKTSKTKSRHAKKSSRPDKSDRLATKSSGAGKKSPDKMFGADKTAGQTDRKSDDDKAGVSPSIANANAQMIPPATTAEALVKSLPEKTTITDGATSMTAIAAQATAAAPATAVDQMPADDDSQVVESDQLNELDRAAASDQKPATKILRPVSQTTHVVSAGSDDAWGQTSLIGKIFIGFGGLLTLASAARMFIA